MLRKDKLPDELVCGLRVQRQGVAQRLQVWALLQEGLLQAHTASVEVLLCTHNRHQYTHARWRSHVLRTHTLGVELNRRLLLS